MVKCITSFNVQILNDIQTSHWQLTQLAFSFQRITGNSEVYLHIPFMHLLHLYLSIPTYVSQHFIIIFSDIQKITQNFTVNIHKPTTQIPALTLYCTCFFFSCFYPSTCQSSLLHFSCHSKQVAASIYFLLNISASPYIFYVKKNRKCYFV